MPPLPLDERIVVIQRPKSLALPQQHGGSSNGHHAPRSDLLPQRPLPQARLHPHPPDPNGHHPNGHHPNGHHPNGHHPSGHHPSGHHPNGHHPSGSSLECKRRSRSQKVRGERERGVGWDNSTSGGHLGPAPSHCHSNGTVTLGPRPHKHTHTIDIRLSLDKGGRNSNSSGSNHVEKGLPSSLTRGGSSRSGRGGRKVSLQVDPVQPERRSSSLKKGGAVQSSQKPLQQQQQQQLASQPQNQLCVSPGGVLEFIPAQRQQSNKTRKEREARTTPTAAVANGNSHPGSTTGSRGKRGPVSNGNKENTKLGPVHQPAAHPHSLSRQHASSSSTLTPTLTPTPHAALLSSLYPPPPPPPQVQPPLPPSCSSRGAPTSSSRHHHHFPPTLTLHGLPALTLSPSASSREGFPSPDHTCTIDLSHPFSCGCWRLVRCRGGRNHAHGHAHGPTPSSSFSRAHGGPAAAAQGGSMGLRTLGGCLSTGSTTNTSSSNSTVSECRAGLLRPLAGCASCSHDTGGGGGGFESPAAFRKKLVGGCLPCAPLGSSAPLRALQSCVSGCNPKASQTASSTCSYCSSDPIVVTFNPHRGKQQQQQQQQQPGPMHGSGRGGGGGGGGGGGRGGFAAGNHDDDDYSVRTIWPEELAKKMTRSKTHGGSVHHPGPAGCTGHEQNGGHSPGNPVILDCRNLLELTRSQLTDHAGRRRLQQGKSAVLDFIGSGDSGRDSLKRLWTAGGDAGMMGDANGLDDDMMPRSPSPRSRAPSSAPQSPPSFSPPPSAHGTLIKPKPRQRERDREGGHSLPSAQSLHLVLNSLNQEQDEDNGRGHLTLPLSSSLPASLSDETLMTPDVENAVISPILPFLFLGNERDAQDLELLLRLGVTCVVNVTTHLPLYHLDTGLVRYKRLPATDNSKQNLRQYFEEVFEFIEEAHQGGRGVLVHCQAGVSRSATMVIAYLMKHTLMTMTDAYKYVRGRRPVVSPNLNFMGQLLEFERDLNSGVTPRILTPKLTGLETQV
ncbi:uncharacterized protein si:dkey-175m17.7 [Sardina pilchardus]|uniref:uncharacterized protein si:dkey-175m17.7 n=1 Tax=Sardina pilchardus TaxID=27697 RepID=UPI002E15FE11